MNASAAQAIGTVHGRTYRTLDCFIPDFFSGHSGFINKVESGCWEWNRWITRDGYGRARSPGRSILAHRCAYEAEHGNGSARGKLVLHRCHNPRCVNPAHLELGDDAENARQMREAERQCRGEDSPKAKLSEKKVIDLRRRLGAGGSMAAVAKDLGIDMLTVKQAATGYTWAHVPGAIRDKSIKRAFKLVLTRDDALAIRSKLAAGSRNIDLAAEYGVCENMIYLIKINKRWRNA